MILMTLQRTNTDGEGPDDFTLPCRQELFAGELMASDSSFVPSNAIDLNTGEPLQDMGVGKKALHRFVQRVQTTTIDLSES